MKAEAPDSLRDNMRTAVITGVSRGLGLAIAKAFLASEWSIMGLSRSETQAWQTLSQQFPGRTSWHRVDLSDPAALERELPSLLPYNRPIHALVNNAAMAYEDLVTNLDLAKTAEMFNTNVLGALALTRGVLRNMIFHSIRGAIVHISSVTVHSGSKGLAMYAASKGALEAFSRGTAREWGERGIRSNCVVPGYMETEMTVSLPPDSRDKIYRRAALRGPTQVESVASTVVFLAGEGAASITGQSIMVDAGLI